MAEEVVVEVVDRILDFRGIGAGNSLVVLALDA